MRALIATVLLLSAFTASTAVVIDFSEHPESQEVRFNESVTLQCAVSNGEVTHWLFNNGPLPSEGVTTNGGMLVISSFQLQLAGNYRCVARSTDGAFTQVSHYARISHFTQRQFESQPEDYVVYLLSDSRREAAVFQCDFNKLRNGTRPVIRWDVRTGDNTTTLQPIVTAGRFIPFQYDHSAYLELHFPVEADNGTEVRCVASDPGRPDQIVESNWARVIISNEALPPDTAVFSLRPPNQVHFIEGQRLVLGCAKTIRNVSTGLHWDISGQTIFIQAFGDLLPPPMNVEFYGFTNIILEQPSSNHTGITYGCSTDVQGGSLVRVNTTVTAPPPPSPLPAYSDQSASDGFPYGSSENLRVDNYTGAIQWWHNGTAITGSTTKYTLVPSSSTLQINNVIFNDAGIYQAELLDASPVRQFFIFVVTVFDVDECEQNQHNCHTNAACMNTVGSYTCQCNTGFQGDGRNCTDINECAQDQDDCHTYASCINTFGSYTCQCNGGFGGNGRSCTDIDECAQDLDDCHTNAACMNTVGSYTCQCNIGFQGDGRNCTDINECAQDQDDCHTYASCINTFGSYTCQCNGGFGGNGRSCTDIDECAQDLDDCHTNAACMNTVGSYTCQCNIGFQGDGRNCTEFATPTITNVELVDGTNLHVNWTIRVQYVGSYVLQILRYEDNRLRENWTVTVNQTFYVLKNANLNSEYRFRVQAISDTGNSTFTQQHVILLKPEGVGLRAWHIALIVIFLLLAVLLCCILCCCIAILWKERRRTYYAEKQEKAYAEDFAEYRMTDNVKV